MTRFACLALALVVACGDDDDPRGGAADASMPTPTPDAAVADAMPEPPAFVVGVTPAPHSVGAAVDTRLLIQFAQAVDPADLPSIEVFGRWSGVPGERSISIGADDASVVAVDFATEFSAGEQVTAIVHADGRSYTWQFWVAAQPATMTFTALSPMTTRTDPQETSRAYGGVGADLNEDGYLDIAVVNEDTADVRVFLSTADGTSTFAPFGVPTFPVNQRASPNEPQDFDGDGHVDLCVANIDAGTVSILLGNGDGTFQPQQELAVGAAPRGIAPMDIDSDGDFDVVVTVAEAGHIALLRNTGGVFEVLDPHPSPVPAPWALGAADMDNDGILDLVIGERDTGTIAVMRGRGNSTFDVVGTQDAAGAPWMLVLGDVDGDLDADVAVANSAIDNGAILLNQDGGGSLGQATVSEMSGFPLASDLGDVDGDGDLDWILSNFSGGDWTLLTNDGAGQFAIDRAIPAPITGSCALMLDTDNDGDLDLALIDELADELVILVHE